MRISFWVTTYLGNGELFNDPVWDAEQVELDLIGWINI